MFVFPHGVQMTTASPNRPTTLSFADHRLCARVARLYYESELTQEQIGEFLGFSRMKVNRLLRLATTSGVVQIQIVGPDEPHADLLHRLLLEFRLRDARIISTPLPEQSLRAVLAAAAAEWLADQLEDGLVVGLGLGRTVALMPDSFAVRRPVAGRFVTLEGVGVSANAGFAAYDVTSRLAEAAGGTAGIISAPTFVSSASVRSALMGEPAVRDALDVARTAGLMLQSVGTVTTDALLFRHGTLTGADLQALVQSGAVGDALGHFFDAEGVHIPWPTDDLHIGLTLDELKACPSSALVAGGEEKVLAIRAAIRGRIANTLITDAATAEGLLGVGA
jgi:DNA-binding transcriptional regulator LsrR (DeoR family)